MRTFITPLVLISILAGAGCTTGVRVSYEPARLDLGPVETYRSGICATKTSVPKELTGKVDKKETDPRKRDTDGDGKDDNVDKHPRNPKKG